MKSILIAGAGRSASSLISRLEEKRNVLNATVTVGDISFPTESETGDRIHFDIADVERSRRAIRAADVVVSMIPAHHHPAIAAICLEERRHLFTASYVSAEMREFDAEAKKRDLLFLNECGLDPGIDHMSAMQVIDHIQNGGGKLISFESFTGGLIAPATDPENPWRYKFTWNPRNVVMAGQGVSKFLQHGRHRYIPYSQLFRRITPVAIPGHGEYEGYVNRDSLQYLATYGLDGIQTMIRGTLRYPGFCAAWDVLVQLGCTDDSYEMDRVEAMTHRDFMESFLGADAAKGTEEKVAEQVHLHGAGPEILRLRWSGLFSDEKIGIRRGTPAQILEHILNKRWALQPGDLDRVVMWHRFVYKSDGATREIQSSLVADGIDERQTAMAKTVGLPLAIAVQLMLEGKINRRGVAIPATKEFYEPILAELARCGVRLLEREVT